MHAMILTSAALIASITAISVQAQPPVRQADDTVIVSYADLDLNRSDQARILDHRLKVAARRVCSDAHLTISHYRLRHLCIRATLTDAWSQVAAARPVQGAENRVTLAAVRTQAF